LKTNFIELSQIKTFNRKTIEKNQRIRVAIIEDGSALLPTLSKLIETDSAFKVEGGCPNTAAALLLMLTVFEDTDSVFSALRAGASGYLKQHQIHGKLIVPLRDRETGHSRTEKAVPRARHDSKTRRSGSGELLPALTVTTTNGFLS